MDPKERDRRALGLAVDTQPRPDHRNLLKLIKGGLRAAEGMAYLSSLYFGHLYWNEQNQTAGSVAGAILLFGAFRLLDKFLPGDADVSESDEISSY